MTGNQLKELLNMYGLSQKKASEIFGVSEVTMSKNVNMGEEPVSSFIRKKAYDFAIHRSYQDLVKCMENLNELYRQQLEL